MPYRNTKSARAARRSWRNPEIRARRTASLRKSNSRPRTVEHRRKLGLAQKGHKPTLATRRKTSRTCKKRLADLSNNQCRMCGSIKHTYAEHQTRLSAGRKRSPIWHDAIVASNKLRKPELMPRVWANRTDAQNSAILAKGWATRIRRGHFPSTLVYHQLSGSKVILKSTWEVAFATWCDKLKIKWQYEPKRFFVGKGAWRGQTYCPDFWLPQLGVYVEIKGWLEKRQEAKYTKFHEMYPKVQVIMIREASDLAFASALAFAEAA